MKIICHKSVHGDNLSSNRINNGLHGGIIHRGLRGKSLNTPLRLRLGIVNRLESWMAIKGENERRNSNTFTTTILG
ncbi:unnamed protein product [Linum trigynum]|uniref:Uncharacterized protein n=1 Tax=Linum trigynum TaxID=586398 RepID=A0AAV2ED83_9ROSI